MKMLVIADIALSSLVAVGWSLVAQAAGAGNHVLESTVAITGPVIVALIAQAGRQASLAPRPPAVTIFWAALSSGMVAGGAAVLIGFAPVLFGKPELPEKVVWGVASILGFAGARDTLKFVLEIARARWGNIKP